MCLSYRRTILICAKAGSALSAFRYRGANAPLGDRDAALRLCKMRCREVTRSGTASTTLCNYENAFPMVGDGVGQRARELLRGSARPVRLLSMRGRSLKDFSCERNNAHTLRPRIRIAVCSSSSRTIGRTRLPKYSTSSWKCRKPSRMRSTPALFSSTMRRAICSGVPVSPAAEAVVILHEILESGFCPIALALRPRHCRHFALHNERRARLRDRHVPDVLRTFCVGLGWPGDGETVDAHLDAMTYFAALALMSSTCALIPSRCCRR